MICVGVYVVFIQLYVYFLCNTWMWSDIYTNSLHVNMCKILSKTHSNAKTYISEQNRIEHNNMFIGLIRYISLAYIHHLHVYVNVKLCGIQKDKETNIHQDIHGNRIRTIFAQAVITVLGIPKVNWAGKWPEFDISNISTRYDFKIYQQFVQHTCWLSYRTHMICWFLTVVLYIRPHQQ